MEDPEKLFKKKDKEKIDFSLFGASSSRDSPSIFYQEWEVNVERSLLKTKSESDLKNAEFNSHTLESYLMDSLWRDLQQTTKVETFAVQNTQKSSVPLNHLDQWKPDLLPCVCLLYYMTLLRIIPKEFLYLMEKVT